MSGDGIAFSELVKLVLEDHRRRDLDRKISVLPVVCVGRPPGGATGTLLASAFEAEEGVALVAEKLADGVRGELDGLHLAAETVLNPDDPDRPPLTLSEGEGKIKAEFPSSSGAWSPGQRNLAGGLLAAFDSRLRQSEIALLTYDETTLDSDGADALWQFYCLHLRQYEVGKLRTLVLVCHTAKLVPPRHCQKYLSARFILAGEKVNRRREWDVDQNEIRLRGEEASNPTVLFLAAGFSSSSQVNGGDLPMGNELRDVALERLIGGFDDEAEAAIRFRAYCENRGALLAGESSMGDLEFERGLTLERVLQLELNETPDPLGSTLTKFQDEVEKARKTPGECLNVLAELLESGSRLVLVTVNFDELIEHRCGGLIERFATAEEFKGAPDYLGRYASGEDLSAPLLKLHGTLSDPNSIVATVASVAKGLPTAKAEALDCLLGASSLEPWSWFYIGASMRDRDILRHISNRKFAERTSEWWVGPSRDQSVEQFIRDIRKPVWQELGMSFDAKAKCITTTADIFMGELQTSLTQS